MSLPPAIASRCRSITGTENVIDDAVHLRMWERDGSFARGVPDLVVLPGSTAEVAAIVRLAHEDRIPVVARGAGTGLTGGAVCTQGGIVLQTTRLRRIRSLDPEAGTAMVESGVANAQLSAAAAAYGLFYAPDPSSLRTCTIEGNVAENSGGPRGLRYGVTTDHVLALEVVLADGTVHFISREAGAGLDLVGLIVGSEGTLAIVTAALVRLLPTPAAEATLVAAFPSVAEGCAGAGTILARSLLPSSLELMDEMTVGAIERRYRVGYPGAGAAVLLAQFEGSADEVAEHVDQARQVARAHSGFAIRTLLGQVEAAEWWNGRKRAVAALSTIQPNYYLSDAVVPLSELSGAMGDAREIGDEVGIPVATVSHAGDGTLHPTILFDGQDRRTASRVPAVSQAITRACLARGGAPTSEYGVGTGKADLLSACLGPEDLEVMLEMKRALDPAGILNPGKIFIDGGQRTEPAPARAGVAAEAEWW